MAKGAACGISLAMRTFGRSRRYKKHHRARPHCFFFHPSSVFFCAAWCLHTALLVRLAQAHATDAASVVISSSGRRYRVDLKAMRQTNMETRGSRPVKREVVVGNGDFTCAHCSYHNTANTTGICTMCEQPRR